MNKKGSIFLILFGAVFLAVGAGMGWFAVVSMLKAQHMLKWDECEAEVVSCKLERHSGSKGGSTYSVLAQYQYKIKGIEYKGNRVSLSTGSDNIGSFHQDLYRHLNNSKKGNKTVSCWVNPENAVDSILVRTPRIPMLLFKALFVLVFGAVGLAITLSGILRLLTPDTAAEGYQKQRIRMQGAGAYKVAIAVALYWNAFTLWMTWKALLVFTVAVLPLYFWSLAVSGLIPAAIALYMLMKLNKYGVSFFEMSPLPGVLGGLVSGSIRIPKPVDAVGGFELTLQCIHQYTTKSGKNSTTHKDVLWDETDHIDSAYNYGAEMVLPVKFGIPFSKHPTTVTGNTNGYYWQLKTGAKTPGIDYSALFYVPVKHTEQSSELFDHAQINDSPVTGGSSDSFEDVAKRLSLTFDRSTGDAVTLGFPAFRPVAAIIFLFIFALIWSGVCVVLWRTKAPAFFAGIFTLVDIFVIIGLSHMIFVSTKVEVDPNRCSLGIEKRFAGILYKSKKFDFNQLDEFDYKRGMQSGSTIYYSVVVKIVGGKAVKLGAALDSRSGAKRIAVELAKVVHH